MLFIAFLYSENSILWNSCYHNIQDRLENTMMLPYGIEIFRGIVYYGISLWYYNIKRNHDVPLFF